MIYHPVHIRLQQDIAESIDEDMKLMMMIISHHENTIPVIELPILDMGELIAPPTFQQKLVSKYSP